MDFESRWSALAQAMHEAGDKENAAKVQELEQKRQMGEMVLAFCGHFSAGKSSLVNRLCGYPLLPSGPVPTSANAVKIRRGEPGAWITRKNGFMEKVAVERLGDACRGGKTAELVEIRWPIPFDDHTALLDTPGIDSTDEAHKLAAESALHMADVVFYVMDYHYVQSEMNFVFAKQLAEWGKPLYLIINQIDKHKERELSFADFQTGVKEAFARWNIVPEGILYLSLKQPEHPHNEYGKLERLLRELANDSKELQAWTSDRSAVHLMKEHMKEMSGARELEKSLYREALGEVASEDGVLDAIIGQEERLRQQLAELKTLPDRLMPQWRKELASTIDNANLTPAATRDLALRFLESRKPGFKAGWFASAAKTAGETRKRLEALYGALRENVDAALVWHVQDDLKRFADAHGVLDREIAEAIAGCTAELTPEWLVRQVHPGAEASGEYTLQFAKRISEELKQQVKRKAYAVAELVADRLRGLKQAEAEKMRAELEALAVRLAAAKGLMRLKQEEQAHERRLQEIFHGAAGVRPKRPSLPDPAVWPAVPCASAESAFDAGTGISEKREQEKAREGGESVLSGAAGPEPAAADSPAYRSKLIRAAAMLREAAELLSDISWLAPTVRSLLERAAKLEGNRFTIALFGAFSAGKSSFANALFGERLLPVSPNPTTAAITTVLAPTQQCPHGTVLVSMKPRGELMEEIAYSLQALGLEAKGEDDMLHEISQLLPERVSAAGKPHLTFLKAVEKGWEWAMKQLGQDMRVGLDRFADYTADETKACFVRSVELYYANPLTLQGIVLVDTPGADSINARHTGVAFNYIKNADAILFVTYYNHAFSRADREFLLQLGRVKDSFELDKMFFVVNAIDLAASPEELAGVLEHVGDNLLRHGIRNPRLYPVSGLMAIEAKLEGSGARLEASGIARFERDFRRFALDELADMAVRSARKEAQRAAAQLDRWLEAAGRDAAERASALEKLEQANRLAASALEEPPVADERQELSKEISELLYYVKQRVMYRFGEFYQYTFHPSVLQEDGRDIAKTMQSAWRELVRMLSYALSQEVLATTLRTEQFIKRRAEKLWHEYADRIRRFVEDYEPPAFEGPAAFRTPEVSETVAVLEPDGRMLAGYYKSGRHFFEGEGKEKLRSALEKELSAAVSSYVEEHQRLLLQVYAEQQEECIASFVTTQAAALSDHCAGLRAVLEAKADMQEMTRIKRRLEQLLYDTVSVSAPG